MGGPSLRPTEKSKRGVRLKPNSALESQIA
jgi:hypothetical protein